VSEPSELTELRRRAGEIADLAGIGGLLHWDQNTMMPPGGADARSDQLEALERILHDRVTDPALGKLLDALEPFERDADPESDEAALIRNLRRDHQKAVNVPTDLAAEISSVSSHALTAWMAARDAEDYSLFAPSLERIIELAHRYIACFEGKQKFAHPYDVLLDDFEPGLTTAELRGLFATIQEELVPLVSAAAAAGEEGHVFPGHFPQAGQKALADEVLRAVGYDPEHWRLDPSVHPFARSMAHTDVRLTTRWEEDDLAMALYSCLHEFGHGLYEAQMSPAHYRTTLAEATGLGVHESQSRLWENLVGRGRPFCEYLLPLLRKHLGGPFEAIEVPELYRNVNQVRLSLIRIEADETTYNLHIALRFELELALIEGRLSVAELPDAWNEATHRLLGLDTPTLKEGVLQDIHWGTGMLGYFPTYTIGNLMSAQLWSALSGELPAIESDIAAGEFAPLREWLRDNIHRHGRKFTSRELLQRVTGEELRVEPFLAYLETKLLDAGLLTEPVRVPRS
jgi:carboxypeptidase Taq